MTTESSPLTHSELKQLTPADSTITLSQVIFPRDTNMLGRVKAGVILKAIDITASLTAGKHSGLSVVTASLDRMDFTNPAGLWELLSTTCRLTRVWKSSMEIEVVVQSENIRAGRENYSLHEIARGYLVFVALDPVTFKPVPIQPLLADTEVDKRRAEEADIRKQNRLLESQRITDRNLTRIEESEPQQVALRTMTPDDSNIHHNVFGGMILELIHEAAEKAAVYQANGPVVAVSQDRMSFEQPAYIGEEVRATAVVTKTFNTSMEIQTDVTARDHKTGDVRHVASSYLVFIAQDAEGNPKPVPAFTPRSELQERRATEAQLRRELRLNEREALSRLTVS